jgi:hypothetical protein
MSDVIHYSLLKSGDIVKHVVVNRKLMTAPFNTVINDLYIIIDTHLSDSNISPVIVSMLSSFRGTIVKWYCNDISPRFELIQ